jgi:hypothetical protein
MQFNGEGIQHVALLSDNLLETIDSLQHGRRAADDGAQRRLLRDARGAPAGPRPAGGRAADARHPARRHDRGRQPRLLLQIFSQTLLGPVFFEFIQRKGDDGFGEGNFKACSSRSSATSPPRRVEVWLKKHEDRPLHLMSPTAARGRARKKRCFGTQRMLKMDVVLSDRPRDLGAVDAGAGPVHARSVS